MTATTSVLVVTVMAPGSANAVAVTVVEVVVVVGTTSVGCTVAVTVTVAGVVRFSTVEQILLATAGTLERRASTATTGLLLHGGAGARASSAEAPARAPAAAAATKWRKSIMTMRLVALENRGRTDEQIRLERLRAPCFRARLLTVDGHAHGTAKLAHHAAFSCFLGARPSGGASDGMSILTPDHSSHAGARPVRRRTRARTC